MSHDQGRVGENNALSIERASQSSPSDPDSPGVTSPPAISISYRPPKRISFSYKPPQLLPSPVPRLKNSAHPKTKLVLPKSKSEPLITNSVSLITNSEHPHPRSLSSSDDTHRASSSSPDDNAVFQPDGPAAQDAAHDNCALNSWFQQRQPKQESRHMEKFLRRGRTESVCQLITKIYDSDEESGWSSDEGSVSSRDGVMTSRDGLMTSRGRKGRRSTSELQVPARPARRTASRSWGLIKQVVHWSPFVQVYKKKYPWVQLAGHNGAFKPCDNGTILKKLTEKEFVCLNKILEDSFMLQITPKFHGKVEKEGVEYVKLQDLLAEFDNPSVCDIKMGTRTYLEEELIKAREKMIMRKDMYEKMVKVDKNEPTEEEHDFKAVTKPRYMQWRERLSSTATLGFRIDGIKQADRDPDKNFKTVRTNQEVAYVLRKHIDYRDETRLKLLERLKEIRSTLEKSKFFASHEVIGSSLLLVHDQPAEGVARANVWMIDFGKTTPLNGDKSLDHRTPWVEGNQEDGYLFGLDNLVELFENLSNIPAPEGLEDDQPAVG